MSDRFAVDPVALRSAGLRLQTLGDAVQAIHDRLARTLDAEGACWGDDETGQAFDEAYRPAAQQTRTTLARAGDRLGTIGDGATALAAVAAAANTGARQLMA